MLSPDTSPQTGWKWLYNNELNCHNVYAGGKVVNREKNATQDDGAIVIAAFGIVWVIYMIARHVWM